jgi:hypothetical protein
MRKRAVVFILVLAAGLLAAQERLLTTAYIKDSPWEWHTLQAEARPRPWEKVRADYPDAPENGSEARNSIRPGRNTTGAMGGA